MSMLFPVREFSVQDKHQVVLKLSELPRRPGTAPRRPLADYLAFAPVLSN